MTGRDLHKEWVGARPTSMPTRKVLLRLYERQNELCACGCDTRMDFDRDAIDCDHIVPLKDGGENREANLQLLLRRHHVTKTSAENIARAEAERHQAKAFTVTRDRRQKIRSAGFPRVEPQLSASTPHHKHIGQFAEERQEDTK